jgi:hypothetical protein
MHPGELAVRRPGAAPAAIVEETGIVLVHIVPIRRAGRALELDPGVATDGARLPKRRRFQI